MKQGRTRAATVAVALVVAMLAAGCSSSGSDGASTPSSTTGGRAGVAPRAKATGQYATDLGLKVDPGEKTAKATFEVQPGTEEVTVLGGKPKQRFSLIDAGGNRLVVLKADRFGQVHFSYLPTKLAEFQTGARTKLPTSDGFPVAAGDGYTVRSEDTSPVQASKAFHVLGRDDNPKPSFFDAEKGKLGPTGDETSWFGYETMRDGVQLSINVRLPGPPDKGPYPTVVEYSGYGPANPNAQEPGSMIAGLLGYATIGVNMRGTGCSGGVFDVFNTAQQVDGYDMIEGLARQPWVKDHKVGMVGLSYSGITQLYVAATQPPHLAAVTSLSVIKDPWLEQWPGGVYNGGFTKSWLEERDRESSATGTSWVGERIAAGDDTCKANQELREQNIDFESFGRSLVRRPLQDDDRDLSKLVDRIKVPVYLTGAWQDEQTGPQFADMLGRFTNAPVKRFTMFNGRHPDGYTPLVLTRWYEFLEFFVDKKVPRLSDGIRSAAPAVLRDSFGDVDGLDFEPDRFTKFRDDQYAEALAAYEKEPDVRVLFDVGGAPGTKPGSPVATFDKSYSSWPPSETKAQDFYLTPAGVLGTAGAPVATGGEQFANDPSAAPVDFCKTECGLLDPTWDFDWTNYGKGNGLEYVTKPFTKDTVLGGPGYADLFVQVPDGDADVQVTLSLIRPDGTEWKVTTGELRLSDRKVDASRSKGLLIERTYSKADARAMPKGSYAEAKVAFPSFAQAFRKGDRLRVAISSPGRDFAAWTFTGIGKAGTPRIIGFGQDHPSKIVLGVLPGISKVPAIDTACPSLRGQACRPYTPTPNTPSP
ncbi:MAG: Cocaine esterase [Acidimicrobiales bacterium]|nr:Cocaine esterase [Acidimicrobiales bacterium]